MPHPTETMDPYDLGARLRSTATRRPRLFLTDAGAAALRNRLDADVMLRRFAAVVVERARCTLDASPPRRKLVGGYPTMLSVSREYLRRICRLAFAFLMTGDGRFARRAEAHMLAAAGFEDWVPWHFLDAAEMTAALAIGYDWLHDELSAESRAIIRRAIVDKGIDPSFELATEGPRVIEDGTWPIRDDNNWTQVGHAGVVLGALAIAEDEPDRAGAVIGRALRCLPRVMAGIYPDDGAYEEGPMYWGYGTTFNVMLINALHTALDSTFDLQTHGGFLNTPDYQLHATGPTGAWFNYGDCREDATLEPAMFWFASWLKRPELLWHEAAKIRTCLAAPDSDAARRYLNHRLLPLVLLWSPPLHDIPRPAIRHWRGGGDNPVAMHRTGWDGDATYLAIKAGSPGCDHGHMDVGSFVFEWAGVRWAIDLGLQEYETLGPELWNPAQDSFRWRVFRLNNHSHNTLVVDGRHQRVVGRGSIRWFRADNVSPATVIEMSDVYAGDLASARRGVALLDARAGLIRDQIEACDRPATVRWAMATRAQCELRSDRLALLRQDGKTLALYVLSPSDVRLRLDEIAAPLMPHDAPNPGVRMISFEVAVPPRRRATLEVMLLPPPDDPDRTHDTASRLRVTMAWQEMFD